MDTKNVKVFVAAALTERCHIYLSHSIHLSNSILNTFCMNETLYSEIDFSILVLFHSALLQNKKKPIQVHKAELS